jgi:hypothetical protein
VEPKWLLFEAPDRHTFSKDGMSNVPGPA